MARREHNLQKNGRLKPEVELQLRDIIIHCEVQPTRKEISRLSGIPEGTLNWWHAENQNGFRAMWDGWIRDWRVLQAERNIDDVLTMDTKSEILLEGVPTGLKVEDTNLRKMKADMSKFVVETLGKGKGYTKGTENKNLNVNIEVTDTEAITNLTHTLNSNMRELELSKED